MVKDSSKVSQKKPAPMQIQVSRLLSRTCMKKRMTSSTLQTAMVSARMVLGIRPD